MIRSPRSLQTRIMLVVMGALLLGMAALYAHVSQHLRSDMQQALGDQQFATVSLVASDIDRELTDRIKALEGVAGGIDAKLLADATALQQFLDDRHILPMLFNREAIAEGVETLEHGAMLLRLGCELGQGYGIARPMPGEEFPVWAAAWQVDASWSDQSAIDPVDLPLLYAGIEHRVWTAALEKHLQDPAEQPAPEPQQGSRFERWLQTQGLQRYGGYANFSALQTVHTQLAALAAQMLVLQSQGQRAQVMQRFDELHRLDQLLHVHLAGMVRMLRSAS